MVFPSVSSPFDRLPRPPTPPKDTTKDGPLSVTQDIDDALAFLEDSFETERPIKAVGSYVPSQSLADHTPPSSTEHRTGSRKRIKRVDFSPWNNYHKPNEKRSSPLKPIPQSRISKPLKSILKTADPIATATIEPVIAPLCSSLEFVSFPEMLQQVVQQLTSESKDARLDAYACMGNALKAWDEVAEAEELQKKTGLFSQFIQRDITAINTATNGPDSALAAQAIKFALALMRVPVVTAAMDDDFKNFLIERSISIISDSTAPKAIINHHLYLLAQQRFGPKILTNARVERIVDCLRNIHDNIKGNNIIGYRLLVYLRLVQQAPSIMAMKISCWFEHVFHGMLSSIKEIRSNAIELGITAGVSLGGNRQASKVVMDLLNSEIEPERTYATYIAARIEKMLLKKEDAQQAPRIWSVIVLFLKGWKQKPDAWRHFKTWLTLFNRFVNVSDPAVKIQTYTAWNRFVYILQPDAQTTPAMISLLQTVVRTQHDTRHGGEKLPSGLRISAFSCYYNLLYYSLRPSSPWASIDTYFDAFVMDILDPLVETIPDAARMACRILTVLFGGGSCHQLWKESRVTEPLQVQVEELPSLEVKWIRQRLPKILGLVQKCLKFGSWSSVTADTDIPQTKSAVRSMWTSLMRAIGEAGRKEVTVSMELKEAIAHITNLFHRLWSTQTSSLSAEEDDFETWSERFGFLVQTAMHELGALHFADKVLVRNDQADLEPAPTPSHRSKACGTLESPIVHLLRLSLGFSSERGEVVELVRLFLGTCLAAKSSRQAKLELLRECALVISLAEVTPLASQFWQMIVGMTLDMHAERSPKHTQREYDSIRTILVCGLLFNDDDSHEAIRTIFIHFSDIVSAELGNSAIILIVTEPLSGAIFTHLSTMPLETALFSASLILKNIPHPKNRQMFETAQKALSNVALTPSKMAEFNPYSALYRLLTDLSTRAYSNFSAAVCAQSKQFLLALSSSICSCPPPLAGMYLQHLQLALTRWIEDLGHILVDPSVEKDSVYPEVSFDVFLGDAFSLMGPQVFQLWETVIGVLVTLSPYDSAKLKAFDPLISAGLSSSRKGIVNTSIQFWNSSFGTADTLDYPPSTKHALQRLLNIAEISLPTFSVLESFENISVPIFIDSDDSALLSPEKNASKRQSRGASSRRSIRRTPIKSKTKTLRTDFPAKTTASFSPSPVKSATKCLSKGQTPTRRLRHENSQIEFSAIDSSPVTTDQAESQHLTEHQREVMERQIETAAIFSDIRSSPSEQINRADADVSHSIDGLSRRGEKALDTTKARPWTPSSKIGVMDYFLGSSPTPARITQAPAPAPDADADPPSSPPRSVYDSDPSQSEHDTTAVKDDNIVDDFNNELDIDYEREDTSDDEVSETITFEESLIEDDNDLSEEIMSDDRNKESSQDDAAEDPDEELDAQIENEVQAFNAKMDQNPLSNIKEDVFVDAPSEPIDSGEIEVFVDASPVPVKDQVAEGPESPSPKRSGKKKKTAKRGKKTKGSRQQKSHRFQEGPGDMVAEPDGSAVAFQANSNDGEDTRFVDVLEESAAQTTSAHVEDNARESLKPDPPSSRKRKGRPRKSDTGPLKRLRSAGSIIVPDTSESSANSHNIMIENSADIREAPSFTEHALEQVPQKRKRSNLDAEPKVKTSRRSLRLSGTSPQPIVNEQRESMNGPVRKRARSVEAMEDGEDNSNHMPDKRRARVFSQQNPQAVTPTTVATNSSMQEVSSSRGASREASEDEIQSPSATKLYVQESTAAEEQKQQHEATDVSIVEFQPTSPFNTPSAIEGRVRLKPRSILARLQGLLRDVKEAVLGPQEEREADELLFQIRKEVHEAERRGRDKATAN